MIIVIIYINQVILQRSSQLHTLKPKQILESPAFLELVAGVVSKSISSESLFAGARELIISHAGSEYRLRLTSQGKLILTK